MTKVERATQIWSVLSLAAHNRQVLTYDMVAKLTGMARAGLGQCLEPIQSYCLVHNLHPLTILVVSEKTGMPGVGFVAAQDILRFQQEVFRYDWLAHGAPSPEDFEKAVIERPSNGISQIPEEKLLAPAPSIEPQDDWERQHVHGRPPWRTAAPRRSSPRMTGSDSCSAWQQTVGYLYPIWLLAVKDSTNSVLSG